MGNPQIPPGWGAIYCQTWWGDRANIQFSIPIKPGCLLLEETQDYIDRVTADGGTVEAIQCLDDGLYKLGAK